MAYLPLPGLAFSVYRTAHTPSSGGQIDLALMPCRSSNSNSSSSSCSSRRAGGSRCCHVAGLSASRHRACRTSRPRSLTSLTACPRGRERRCPPVRSRLEQPALLNNGEESIPVCDECCLANALFWRSVGSMRPDASTRPPHTSATPPCVGLRPPWRLHACRRPYTSVLSAASRLLDVSACGRAPPEILIF